MRASDPALFPGAVSHIKGLPTYGHLIGRKWVAGRDTPIAVVAPGTAVAFARLARGCADDIDAAVAAARAALGGDWGKTPAAERGRMLTRFSNLILRDAERLAWVEAHDTGKPISQARADIRAVARYFEFYAGGADKIHGEVIPYLNGYSVTVVREPLGVTAHIIPWNYPAQMFGRTIAPALAMGNACVLKPAEDACLVTLELGRLALEAGLPAGALNIVTGLGEEAGAALTAHDDIDFISFTGSPEVGQRVQETAARRHLPVTLELGGKSPQVVFADADLELAAATVCKAVVQNAGQTCSAGSRVIVERPIFEPFLQRVAAKFAELRIGRPEDDADFGPLINPAQQRRVLDFIAAADRDGVPRLAEARPAESLAPGYFVPAVLFGPVPATNPLITREVFGPVLAAQVFDTEDEAVRLANGTEFGLVAGVWTKDGARQHRLAHRIVSGQVFVNCYGAGGGVELPFGGTKRSGHGREKGRIALEEFSLTKTIVNWHG